MQEFTTFDIVIVSLTVLLGLKGLFRGLIKEVFSLIAIIGAIFVASRMSETIGKSVAPILGLENNATISLIGFILGLIGFWAAVYLLGVIISKIFNASGLGLFDRIFGLVFGGAKIFLIFSVITYGLYQVKSFTNLMDQKIGKSMTLPFLLKTGGFIVKLDPSVFIKKSEEKKEETIEEPVLEEKKTLSKELTKTMEELKKTTIQSGTAVVDSVKKAVDENVEKISNEIKESAQKVEEQKTENPSPEEKN